MRKKTIYNVTGVLDIKPENLPEGLKVDELEVDNMESLHIGAFTFEDSIMKENGVYIRKNDTTFGDRHLTKEQTRELRDFLNKVLDDEKPIRVILDYSGDLWFELNPDQFTFGAYERSSENPLDKAKDRLKEFMSDGLSSSFVNKSEAYISSQYGPIKFLANVKE